MQAQFLLNAGFLFISATLTFIAAIIAWKRKVPGSFVLSLLLVAMSTWSFFYALQWLPLPGSIKILLPNFAYMGVIAVPTLFLAFSLSFTNHENWLTRRNLFLLAIVPLLTLFLVWTNSRHHLMFEPIAVQEQNGFATLELVSGPWYKVNVFYSYAVILTGLAILIRGMWHSSPLLKNQYRVILFAVLIPWVMSIYSEITGQASQLDFAPLAFGFSGILLTYSIVRNRFMDIIPVARSQLIENMSDGILVLDLQDRIVDINPAVEKFLQRKPASLLGKPVTEALEMWGEKADALVSGEETRIELRTPESPARYLDLRVTPLYDSRQRLNGRLMVFRDVTDRKQVEKKLRYANERLQAQLIEIGTLQSKLRSQAIRDPLTNLFNRRYLDETLDRELARAARETYPLCVIMMDIDHFKKLNDSHGHEAGDLVLKALAGTLLSRNRRGDFTCRFGGEEFVVVMPNIAIDTAYKRARQLRQALNSLSVPFGDASLSITISTGIACYPANGDDRESLLRAADQAMYGAKRAGRDHILTYDQLDLTTEPLGN